MNQADKQAAKCGVVAAIAFVAIVCCVDPPEKATFYDEGAFDPRESVEVFPCHDRKQWDFCESCAPSNVTPEEPD